VFHRHGEPFVAFHQVADGSPIRRPA
jgi:hypothetical protein